MAAIVDSIPKITPDFAYMHRFNKPGATTVSLTRGILNKSTRVGGFKVVLVPVGTNRLAPVKLVTNGEVQWSTPSVEEVLAEFKMLRSAIRRYNFHALLIFSAILPRPCDFEVTGSLVLAVNTRLKAWCRDEPNQAFIDCSEQFIHQQGDLMGEPRAELFTVEDALHLNKRGLHHLADAWRECLRPHALKHLARVARRK